MYRVLIAEDEDIIRKGIAYTMDWVSMGCTIVGEAANGKEGIEKFLRRNPKTCFVAEEDGEIAGAILAGNDGRRGYIYHTAVNPDFRNQGIGTALVEAAMAALKALDINKVALVVFSKNRDGNAFWEKLGFTARDDLVYRNNTITEMIRTDT